MLDVRFVYLPGMAVLKIIAWQERHNEFPAKDAVDIATLFKYYPEAGNDERILAQHADSMETVDFDFEMAGARMLGRDMTKIITPQTQKAVLEILELHTDPDKNDGLIQAITICCRRLMHSATGLDENAKSTSQRESRKYGPHPSFM